MAGGGPTWYSPTDSWPNHSKPWFRAALSRARSAGWWYRSASHDHGIAFCRDPDNRAGACKFAVYSTGGAGESAAKEFERLIRRCPHNQDSFADPLAGALAQMDKVDALCGAVEALMDKFDYTQDAAALIDRAEHLMEQAGDRTSEVDAALSAALDLELEAAAATAAAEQMLSVTATVTREPDQLLDIADQTTTQVRAKLKDQPASSEVRKLRERVRAARTRIRELRSRLPQR